MKFESSQRSQIQVNGVPSNSITYLQNACFPQNVIRQLPMQFDDSYIIHCGLPYVLPYSALLGTGNKSLVFLI